MARQRDLMLGQLANVTAIEAVTDTSRSAPTIPAALDDLAAERVATPVVVMMEESLCPSSSSVGATVGAR